MSNSNATETLARIEHVCSQSANGIYSVGATAALRVMATHWKDHLGEGHPATTVTDDIEGLIEELQHMKQQLLPAGTAEPVLASAPAADQQGLTVFKLLDELRSRGQVVSSWGREYLAFLDEADWTEALTEEQLENLKDLVMERASSGLQDILGQRGNEYLSDWTFENQQALLEASTKVPPVPEESVQDVIDDILARAKKYDFTVNEANAHELVAESSNLLDIAMPPEQIEDAARRALQAKEKAEQMEAVDTPENRFDYQLLCRLQQDCEYYLGHGNRAKKHLWAGDEAEQVAKMKELFEKLPIKPEWISLEKIEQYQAAMTGQPQS